MDGTIETRTTARDLSPQGSEKTAPKARKRGRSRWLMIGIAVLALLALSYWWLQQRQSSTVHYETAAVTRGAISREVVATGTVNPELTIIVGSYVSGVIQNLQCDYNTIVKAGQICATIDPRPYQTVVSQDVANLSVAEAQLKKDQANLTYAELNYGRAQRLIDTHAVSQDSVDVARNLVDQARAQIALDEATIDQRKAELSAAQINLEYTNIRSPVNGIVVSRNVSQGQTVAASFQTPTLFLIATDLTRMQVDTNVSESDIGAIHNAQLASFTVDAFPDRIFEGAVTQVRQSPQTVQNIVTFDAVVSAANQDLVLKPGMTASLRIVVDKRENVLRVPNQALRYQPGGIAKAGQEETSAGSAASSSPTAASNAQVWVLRQGAAIAVPVTTGLADESYTEIVSGDLRQNDAVIISQSDTATSTSSVFRFPRL